GEPVPGEHALGRDDESVAKGGDGFAKGVGIGGEVFVQQDGAGAIDDAQVHCSGMQIDAAIESVLLLVETHPLLLWDGTGSEPESWYEAHLRIHVGTRPRP